MNVKALLFSLSLSFGWLGGGSLLAQAASYDTLLVDFVTAHRLPLGTTCRTQAMG
ncbi:MAG: hypothetical protein R2795_11715 [Saprospiraceae bacterium]